MVAKAKYALRAGKELVKGREVAKEPARSQRFTDFGDVTVLIGGPGAVIIMERATKLPRLYSRFHATPKQACTAGILPGKPCGKVGWCMFAH